MHAFSASHLRRAAVRTSRRRHCRRCSRTSRAERRAARGTSRGATAGRARAVSRLLVMGEIAMAVMLVAAAGLTVRSLQQLLRQDSGFTTRGVLTFTVSITRRTPKRPGSASHDSFSHSKSGSGAAGRVESAGAINMLPIAQTGTNGQVYCPTASSSREESPIAELRAVTPGYFRRSACH